MTDNMTEITVTLPWSYDFVWVFAGLLMVVLVLIVAVVEYRRRGVPSMLLWILVVAALPVLGLIGWVFYALSRRSSGGNSRRYQDEPFSIGRKR